MFKKYSSDSSGDEMVSAEVPLYNSQNFHLRLSDITNDSSEKNDVSNGATDTANKNNNNSIIIISDSDGTSSASPSRNLPGSSKLFLERLKTWRRSSSSSDNVVIVENSESERSKSTEKQKEVRRVGKRSKISWKKKQYYEQDLYSSESDSDFIHLGNESSGKEFQKKDTSSQISKDVRIQRATFSSNNSDKSISSESKRSSSNSDNRKVEISDSNDSQTEIPGSQKVQNEFDATKPQIRKIETPGKLTRKETKKILDVIKSNRIVYESPKTPRNKIISETSEDETFYGHPALSPKKQLPVVTQEPQINIEKSNRIIDETVSDFENPVDEVEANLEDVNEPVALPKRKLMEISNWIMTTGNESIDSSMSVVPESRHSGVSSGNSSLERLELNYETPNNRGKLNKTKGSSKTLTDFPKENLKIHGTPPDKSEKDGRGLNKDTKISSKTTGRIPLHKLNIEQNYETPKGFLGTKSPSIDSFETPKGRSIYEISEIKKPQKDKIVKSRTVGNSFDENKTPTNVGRNDFDNFKTPPADYRKTLKGNLSSSKPPSTSLRQTTLDKFFKKNKEFQTPDQKIKNHVPRKNFGIDKDCDNVTPDLEKNEGQNVDLLDCADLLDKLYGEDWRKNAADVLPVPKTELRKPSKSHLQNRGVQTEKRIGKSRVFELESSDDDDDSFDMWKKHFSVNSKLNSTRKNTISSEVTRKTPKNISFINDESSSSSGGETSYHTALGNPIVTPSVVPKTPKAPSELIYRAKAICDSESDDDDKPVPVPTRGKKWDKKKLLFTDDESSSTSEFEPGDVVPPKVASPKKTPKARKLTVTPKIVAGRHKNDVQEKARTHSFLSSLSSNVPLSQSHPQAFKYRTDFKNKKEELCKYLFSLYNEKIFDNKLPADMSIEWNVRMRGTAGFCYNRKSVKSFGSVIRSSRIVLATKILDSADRLRDTLVHEMCHAAAWLINEVSDGHGPFWKAWASKAMKAFPELPPIRRCHDYQIKTKYTYRCTKCGYSIGRHSKSLDVKRKICGRCHGVFELLVNRTTKSGAHQIQTPSRTKEPSAFALFVKENYNTVKKSREKLKHGEVMKLLGQQFSAIKLANQNNDNNIVINDIDDSDS